MTDTDDASTYADLLARLGDDGTAEIYSAQYTPR